MHGDGDGWVVCALGHRHWGLHGAAGLLVYSVDDGGVPRVLLQHRAPWSHHGDTWGIPGGARDSHEDAAATALRESREEAELDTEAVRVRTERTDDHGAWGYTTVLADSRHPLPTRPNRESVELRWVPLHEVAALPLHPGFAASWPSVAVPPVTLLVDGANVVGSRPDGWWRDRSAAARRLVDAVDRLRSRLVTSPGGDPLLLRSVVVVLEGQARPAAEQATGFVTVVSARGSGDDALAATAAAGPGPTLVVTADRGLRARLDPATAVAGPGWLLGLLEQPDPPG